MKHRQPPQRGHKAKPAPEAATRKSAYRTGEIKVYGVNMVRALWTARPEDVIKIYLIKDRLDDFEDLIRWSVKQRKAYKLVSEDELQRITESVHHEGICVVARDRGETSFDTVLQTVRSAKAGCLVYLDGVQNPHNVGNILRLCAHFGVQFVLTDAHGMDVLPPSARRVSEGGAEFVSVVRLERPVEALRRLKTLGFQIIATSSHAKAEVFSAELPAKAILILGAEVTGVSRQIEALADANLLIPGTGHVESLNVASACAILVSEYWRRHLRG